MFFLSLLNKPDEIAKIINVVKKAKPILVNQQAIINKAAKKANLYLPIVGHIVEGTGLESKKYPVIGLSEDIRKLEKLFD